MSKSLVIVFNSLNIGGIERKIVDIANYFQEIIPVTLILRYKKGQLLNQIHPHVKIIESSLYPPFLSYQLLLLRPSLILTFGNFCSIFTILSAPFSKIILSEDSSIDMQIDTDTFPLLRRVLVKLTYPFARSIITLTKIGKNKLTKLIPSISKKIVILSNWLPFTVPKTNKTPKDIDVLFLARLEPQKDPIRFLQIIKEIIKTKKKLKVVMVGSGSLLLEIKKYILKNKLTIELIPESPLVTQYYQRSKILLITSSHEGFPLTILESFHHQCLVVCPSLLETNSFFDYFYKTLIYNSNSEAITKVSNLINKPIIRQKITLHYQSKVDRLQSQNFAKTIKHIQKYL